MQTIEPGIAKELTANLLTVDKASGAGCSVFLKPLSYMTTLIVSHTFAIRSIKQKVIYREEWLSKNTGEGI